MGIVKGRGVSPLNLSECCARAEQTYGRWGRGRGGIGGAAAPHGPPQINNQGELAAGYWNQGENPALPLIIPIGDTR